MRIAPPNAKSLADVSAVHNNRKGSCEPSSAAHSAEVAELSEMTKPREGSLPGI